MTGLIYASHHQWQTEWKGNDTNSVNGLLSIYSLAFVSNQFSDQIVKATSVCWLKSWVWWTLRTTPPQKKIEAIKRSTVYNYIDSRGRHFLFQRLKLYEITLRLYCLLERNAMKSSVNQSNTEMCTLVCGRGSRWAPFLSVTCIRSYNSGIRVPPAPFLQEATLESSGVSHAFLSDESIFPDASPPVYHSAFLL